MDPYDSADEDEDSSLEDSEEEEELLAAEEGKEARRPAVYNREGLEDKLADFGWAEKEAWIESLAITALPSGQAVDPNDDLNRELYFYTQALDAAKEGCARLADQGIPVVRPDDYYAEMVKSDEHMKLVKDKLLYEKKTLEGIEERRKQRDLKKFGKSVQAERLKERAHQKKKEIESVKNWRKMRKDSNFADNGEEFQVSMGGFDEEGSAGGKRKRDDARRGGGNVKRGPSQKRAFKDAKFGFGGPKKLKKQNDAGSAGDMDGFRGGMFSEGGKQRGGGKSRGRARDGASLTVYEVALPQAAVAAACLAWVGRAAATAYPGRRCARWNPLFGSSIECA
eukprot:jgi/Mesvir1/12366/Mv00549-RA.1